MRTLIREKWFVCQERQCPPQLQILKEVLAQCLKSLILDRLKLIPSLGKPPSEFPLLLRAVMESAGNHGRFAASSIGRRSSIGHRRDRNR